MDNVNGVNRIIEVKIIHYTGTLSMAKRLNQSVHRHLAHGSSNVGTCHDGSRPMDTVCSPSPQFATHNKIQSRKELRVYPEYGHEPIPGHQDEIFQFMMGL